MVPIGSSPGEPGDQLFELVDRRVELPPSLASTATTVLRLSINCWMVWSLSAGVLENDDVLENSDDSVSP